MAKRIITPWAENGDKDSIPETPVGLLANWQSGYPSSYEEDPGTPESPNPNARFVERDVTNQFYNDVTSNIQEWQNRVYPEFVSPTNNGGTPVSYDINAKVYFEGVLYRSLKNNNTDLIGESGWTEDSNSASLISNDNGGSVQDYIDSTLNSSLDIPSLSGKVSAGDRVSWMGYREAADGGGNWGVVVSGSHTEDGGSVFSINATTYIQANLKGQDVDVRKFGAVADNGVTDNRVQIQNYINYAESHGAPIIINKPEEGTYYGVSSFNPGIVSRNGNPAKKACLLISDTTNMLIRGFNDRNAAIKYYGAEDGDALIYIDNVDAKWGLTVRSLGLDASNKLDHCIHGSDGRQLANVRFTGGSYSKSNLDGIKIAAYMITFQRVLLSEHLRYGVHLAGEYGVDTDGETTSLFVSNCWVRQVGESGYRVSNDLWYSELTSNGCDGLGVTGDVYRTKWAYDFYRARGVKLTTCGAEVCDGYLRAGAHFGLHIDSPVGIGLGATTGTIPALVELGGDGGCTFSNIPYGFDIFEGVDYTVSIDKINPRTRMDVVGLGITRSRVNVLNDDNTPTVFFSSGSGYTRDLGFDRVQDTIYINKNIELQPRDTVSGRYTLARKGCLVDFSGTVDTDPVPILRVTTGGGGTITIQVKDAITKIAGTPNPETSCVTAIGSTVWRSDLGYNRGMSISDSSSSVEANLEWTGDTLYITHNSQWSFHIIDIDVFSRNEGIYVEMLA